jgi:hypothetical protein
MVCRRSGSVHSQPKSNPPKRRCDHLESTIPVRGECTSLCSTDPSRWRAATKTTASNDHAITTDHHQRKRHLLFAAHPALCMQPSPPPSPSAPQRPQPSAHHMPNHLVRNTYPPVDCPQAALDDNNTLRGGLLQSAAVDVNHGCHLVRVTTRLSAEECAPTRRSPLLATRVRVSLIREGHTLGLDS